ncbi:MAG TPA: O-acetyl-ADP-ribose deacetylase [Gammaproteobacteria bacterium]|nr:O-acetyl-ADP-ribose deacetylase [Gammaproteobacteria bacterium]
MTEVLIADITTLDVDVIVNAANTSLLGGGGVDGAIHRAAGPALREACRQLGGCERGDAKITPGFKLPAQWVVHAVGPIWHGGDSGEPAQLRNCYRRAFELARSRQARSIAFSCISTGVYGYPLREAAEIAVSEMRANEQAFERVIACCFDNENAEIYRQLLPSA